ncbi:MAG: methyltransferase domain-containing protein [Neomegalonema sp.]|nr:methyltransferase domain-containing protein [Neomegalonema sp.]
MSLFNMAGLGTAAQAEKIEELKGEIERLQNHILNAEQEYSRRISEMRDLMARTNETHAERVKDLRNKLGTATESHKATVERLRSKLEASSESQQKLRETIDAMRKRQDRMRSPHADEAAALTSGTAAAGRGDQLRRLTERFLEFLDNPYLTLPSKAATIAFQKSLKAQGEGQLEAYLAEQEAERFADFFLMLFWSEMGIATHFDAAKLGFVNTFERGGADVKRAEEAGVSLLENRGDIHKINQERFDRLIVPDMISADEVHRICEIGPAWGGAASYFKNRFSPEAYEIYEIDGAYAQYLEKHMDMLPRPVDGETLSGTEDASIDIAVASSVFYFMPPIKQWSYLSEIGRVLRPGGIAVFNIIIADHMPAKTLEGYLTNYFPRRNFGVIPKKWVELAFPAEQFETLVENDTAQAEYTVIRKRA